MSITTRKYQIKYNNDQITASPRDIKKNVLSKFSSPQMIKRQYAEKLADTIYKDTVSWIQFGVDAYHEK